MEKMMQPATKFALHECNNGRNCSEDWISQFPDEVLVLILSRLTIKEAARTSVLSHRWENLWPFITSLNIEASKKLSVSRTKLRKVKSRKDANWVNQALKSHQAPWIEEFKFRFDSTYGCDASWIKFAIEKRVRKLELEFFPEKGCQVCCLRSLDFGSFKFLTAIRLKFIRVLEEFFDYLLSNCPFLEQLCIVGSDNLGNLKVVGPSLKLKYLKISNCSHMKTIEISAMHLVSFTYSGKKTSVSFKDIPRLVEVSWGGKYCDFIIHEFDELSSYFSQLKTLILHLGVEPFLRFPKNFPPLSNLKHLELEVFSHYGKSFLPCMSLIEACPVLYSLTLKMYSIDSSIQRKLPKAIERCPHLCLKVVELVGFAGGTSDIEVAMYLIENALSLEKMIINPCCRLEGNPLVCLEEEKRRLARECAMRLGTKLPLGVKLVIL